MNEVSQCNHNLFHSFLIVMTTKSICQEPNLQAAWSLSIYVVTLFSILNSHSTEFLCTYQLLNLYL